MQGSQFHLEVLNGDLNEWTDALTANGLPVYGSQLDEAAQSYRQIEPSTICVDCWQRRPGGYQRH